MAEFSLRTIEGHILKESGSGLIIQCEFIERIINVIVERVLDLG